MHATIEARLRSKRSLALSLLAMSLLAGCKSSEPPVAAVEDLPPAVTKNENAIRFEDVTHRSAVVSVYQNGREANENAILESLGGGLGLLDFDRDGRTDLFFPNGGTIASDKTIRGAPNKLFRQLAPFDFQEVGSSASLDEAKYFTHGCSIADADNDGFPDVLVTGYGGLQYYHNLGDGTFAECASEVGLVDDLWSSSAAWGDFNRDGILDIYVTHYVDWSWQNHPKCHVVSAETEDICSPHQFNGLPDCIFLGTTDGTFLKKSHELGLLPEGKGLGVIAADVDLDGDLDIYVANDTTNNFFYLNDGAGNFAEIGLSSGLATDADGIPNGSMGLAVIDSQNDLLPDVWVTNYENETFGLYQNLSNANFNCISQMAGVTALGTLFVGFGTLATDFDLDGDEDLCVANGHVVNFPKRGNTKQQQLLLVNDGRRFQRAEFTPESYFAREHLGRSVVAADFDHDGLQDLVFSNTNEPAAVLRNTTNAKRNWVEVQLVGTHSNRDAIGAHAILKTPQGKQLRCVVGGGGYLSQGLYAMHWGLSDASVIEELMVHWPDGKTQSLVNPAINQKHTLIEPLP